MFLKKSGPSPETEDGPKTKKAYPKTSLDNISLEISNSSRQPRLGKSFLKKEYDLFNILIGKALTY